MLIFPSVPISYAEVALAHLVVGILKADGKVTLAEELHAEDVLLQYDAQLPGDAQQINRYVEQIIVDDDYQKWLPSDHLENAVIYYNLFVETGEAYQEHLTAALQMLRTIMEFEDATTNERNYLANALKAFQEEFEL